jgi:hypothetical protein
MDVKQIQDLIRLWRKDGNYWVRDVFGGNIKLSNQQSHAFTELGKITAAKIKKSKGEKLTEEEERYSKYIGMDISSGMGSGKDFLASLFMFYFLHVWPEEDGQSPHVLATANTAKQLGHVLWRQASSIPQLSVHIDPNDPTSPRLLEELFVCQKEKIYRKERNSNTFFAEAVTVSPHASTDEQARALTGRHAPYMLMVLDEAAGLPEAVFTNLEGTLSGRVNLILMIYNPIKSRGYAVDARRNDRWLSITWNTEETHFDNPSMDIPMQARNKDLLERYGRDSNVYRIRVLGLPPIADTDVFIPWDWVQDAIERPITPDKNDVVVMGVDPAAGGDNSVIVVRHGGVIKHVSRFNLSDTMDFAGRVINEYHRYEPMVINIDPIGIGKGVYDRLRELKYPVEAIDVRRIAKDRDKYDKVRDELWGILRKQFEEGLISIPNDQELIDQLGSIAVKKYTSKGQMVIPTKAEMRAKDSIGGSPDEADAICLTYAVDDVLLKRIFIRELYRDQDEERKDRKRRMKRNRVTGY